MKGISARPLGVAYEKEIGRVDDWQRDEVIRRSLRLLDRESIIRLAFDALEHRHEEPPGLGLTLRLLFLHCPQVESVAKASQDLLSGVYGESA